MKTVLDLVDDVYELLDDGPVHIALSGDIFLHQKPDNYKGDCIVINGLAMTGEQGLQRAVVNVNIIVPNLQLTINKQPDLSQPNRARIKAISDVVLSYLKNALINDTLTGIQTITLINDKELKEHFLNIRVETNSINL